MFVAGSVTDAFTVFDPCGKVDDGVHDHFPLPSAVAVHTGLLFASVTVTVPSATLVCPPIDGVFVSTVDPFSGVVIEIVGGTITVNESFAVAGNPVDGSVTDAVTEGVDPFGKPFVGVQLQSPFPSAVAVHTGLLFASVTVTVPSGTLLVPPIGGVAVSTVDPFSGVVIAIDGAGDAIVN